MTGLVVVSAIVASIALVFAGCSTPVATPSLDVPARFASTATSEMDPEAAWWESFHDPVLTDLVRRAASENRDIKIAAERLRAARSGVTVSRSFLAPSVSAVGSASDRSSGYSDAVKQLMPDTRNGSAGLDVAWEVDLSGRLRAGTAAAAADALAAAHGVRGVRLLVMTDVADQLLHAGRRTAPARHAARDFQPPMTRPAPGAGALSGRPGDALRRGARADRCRIGTRADPAAGDDRGGLAAPHRGADRRPGLPWREHRAVARRRRRA
jgi:hypothetical protein